MHFRYALVLSVALLGACNKSPSDEAKAAPLTAATSAKEIKEIKLGQTMPYSGPLSAYGTIGRLEAAYFKMVNDQGGLNGAKITLISVDDGYSPPKAVEQVRKLVEQEHVVAMFQPLGTPSNSAIQKYLNAKKIPQLFASTGATRWGDPEHFPYTIGFNPTYQLEGLIYAKHILANSPKSTIAVLYQNDDYGKDLLKGLKQGLGDKLKMIVAEASYETTDATIDSQVATLKASKADVFVNICTPKFAAQALRKVYDIGWKPTQYLNNVGASKATVLIPAGLEKAVGVWTTEYIKDPSDPQWDTDPGMLNFRAFMKTHYPEGNVIDASNIYAYVAAQTMLQVLEQCHGDYSSENILKQATNLQNYAPEQLLPGVKISTSPTDYFLFDTLKLAQFDGNIFVLK